MPAVEQKDTARPEFFIDTIKNNAKSELEGRPIFDEKELVKIHIPGQRDNVVLGIDDIIVGTKPPVTAKERWPDYYAAFKRGEMRAAVGTPLEHWPILTRARVAELKHAGILSVDELANIPDNMIGKLGMGARDEREQAKAFIEQAKGGAQTAAMAAEIAQLRQMVEQLTGKAPPPVEAPKDKPIEECTDAELKEFIKRETGEGVRGQPSRETLLARVREIAEGKQAA